MKRLHQYAVAGLLVWGFMPYAAAQTRGRKVAPQPPASVMQTVKPAFSEERLARLDSTVMRSIRAGQLSGAVVAVTHEGKEIRMKAYGMADREAKIPMKPNSIFRIASMTKAVTTVAAMILLEEGKINLSDPVSKFIPSFANLNVAVPRTAPKDSLQYKIVPVNRSMNIFHLLTHTSGLGYGWGAAAKLWGDANLQTWYFANRTETLAQLVDRMATLPLEANPGESWIYGYSSDVLGRVVEVASGMPLAQFMQERIFKPLGMVDTGYWVSPEKAGRLTNLYGLEKGKLELKEVSAQSDYVIGPKICTGGGAGLVSTAPDYTRFMQMLLNGGELDGVRILSRKTVEVMRTNQLGNLYNTKGWGNHQGFGFGFWVNEHAGAGERISSGGAFGWGSAYYPIYFIDPTEKLTVLLFTQVMPWGDLKLSEQIGPLVYQAMNR